MGDRRDTKKRNFFQSPSRLPTVKTAGDRTDCSFAGMHAGVMLQGRIGAAGSRKVFAKPPLGPPKVNVHGQTSGPAPVHVNVMLHRRWGTVETRKKETFFQSPSRLPTVKSAGDRTECSVDGVHADVMLQGRIGAAGSRTKFLQSPPLDPPKSMLMGRSAVTGKLIDQ